METQTPTTEVQPARPSLEHIEVTPGVCGGKPRVKGHRIKVQVQSSWFPLIDRNPQTYVANIFEAKDSDFKPARMKVYRARNAASYVQVDVAGGEPIRP